MAKKGLHTLSLEIETQALGPTLGTELLAAQGFRVARLQNDWMEVELMFKAWRS